MEQPGHGGPGVTEAFVEGGSDWGLPEEPSGAFGEERGVRGGGGSPGTSFLSPAPVEMKDLRSSMDRKRTAPSLHSGCPTPHESCNCLAKILAAASLPWLLTRNLFIFRMTATAT